MYITAGTYVPFNPPKLMDDEEVRSITFETPKNESFVYFFLFVNSFFLDLENLQN